ncbi:HNH endonuclease signature motif containing protein [Subtercola boreus]|nr:HNH endonuclease signature motif containing protein [Subtercola boreus]
MTDERQLRRQQLRADFAAATRAVLAGEQQAARAAAAQLVLVERLRVAGLALHFSDQSSGGPKWSQRVVAQRTVITELAVGAHLSETDARRRVDTAEGLAGPYPATRAALERGSISSRHAEKIVQHGALLPPDSVPEYEARIVPIAERMSVQRLEREARAAVEDAQPTTSVERHVRAVQGRRLVLDPAADGMAWLSLFLPAVEAAAIHNRATGLGRTLKSSGDPRTLAQLRVDALADLALNGESSIPGAPRGLRAHVRVTVPALTLLGHEQAGSAELEGYGPIDRLTALELTRSAPTFQRVLTDPVTGVALSYGRTSYKVPAALDELIRTVHSECTFPLSCTSAATADLDHTVAFAEGGETRLGNLSPLCASHHKVKHHTEWKVEQHPGSGRSAGSLVWTSPAGFAYTVDPTPIARPAPAVRSIQMVRSTQAVRPTPQFVEAAPF